MKFCNKCKLHKDFSEFGKDKSTKSGLKFYCKLCRVTEHKTWYEENRDRRLVQVNKYKKNNADWYKEYFSKYREDNRQLRHKKHRVYYMQHRDAVLARTSKWAKNNRHKRSEIQSRRRARKMMLLDEGVRSDILSIRISEQEGKCFYCAQPIKVGAAHLEHMTPLCRGGCHTESNLVASCPKCNFRKGKKTAKEFMELLEKEKYYA